MKTERLNELKQDVIFRYCLHHGERQEVVLADRNDMLDLIDREIKRIESRRKVPLLPCKCGGTPNRRVYHGTFSGRTVVYTCNKCFSGYVHKATDREAREAWNRSVTPDATHNR